MPETLWKVVEALINTHLYNSLQIHDVLNGFRTGGWTGTAIMELKLYQELAIIDQESLFLVLLDLHKAYDTVDQYRLLITLEGYGADTWMCGLLDTCWYFQQVVTRKNGFHGPAFPAMRGTTQGGIVSQVPFNLVVDNIIRTWLAITIEDHQVDEDILGETVGRCVGVFHADNIMVGSRDPE